MNDKVAKMASSLDAKRDVLKMIRDINPAFYNEFVREFLTDRLTLTDFEKDLVRALQAIAGIMVYVDSETLTVNVRYKLTNGNYSHEELDSYESALYFAIGLLHIR
jgi:hypothetical protein